MKKLTLITFLFCSFFVMSQEKLELEIDKPQPRVGQTVNLTLEIPFIEESILASIDKDIEITGTGSIYGPSTKKFQRNIQFKEAKTYTIGPFEFEFNNKKYVSNSITVDVIPAIPQKAGVYVRIAEFQGEKFLIIEQMIKNVKDGGYDSDGSYSMTLGGSKPKGMEYIDINRELAPGINLLFKFSSEGTAPRTVDFMSKKMGFSYAFRMYKIEFDEKYSGSYILKKTDFLNFPRRTRLEKIEIKK